MSKKAVKAGLDFKVAKKNDSDVPEGMIKIKGIANAPVVDRVGDFIPISTWDTETLTEFMKNPIVLREHDPRNPIGKITKAEARTEGLYVEALISDVYPDTQKLIKQGILKTFSISYKLKDFDIEESTGNWILKDLDLREISVVSVPANQDSFFEQSKHILSEDEYKELRQNMLEEKTKSAEKESEKSDSNEDDESSEEKETEDSVAETDTKSTKEESVVTDSNEKESEKADSEIGDNSTMTDTVKNDDKVEEATKAEETTESKSEEPAVEETSSAEGKNSVGECGGERLVKAGEKAIADRDTEAQDKIQHDYMANEEAISGYKERKASVYGGAEGTKKLNGVDSDTFTDAYILAMAKGHRFEDTDVFKKAMGNKNLTAVTAMTQEVISDNVREIYESNLVVFPQFASIRCETAKNEVPVVATTTGLGVTQVIPGADDSAETNGYAAGTSLEHRQPTISNITLEPGSFYSKIAVNRDTIDDLKINTVGFIRQRQAMDLAFKVDYALIRGDKVSSRVNNNATIGQAPLTGISTHAADVDLEVAMSTTADNVRATVAKIKEAKYKLRQFGSRLNDIVLFVGWDALDAISGDDEFKTYEKTGGNPSIITGEVSRLYGMRVVQTDHLQPAGTRGAIMATLCYTPGFVIGDRYDMRVERDDNRNQNCC